MTTFLSEQEIAQMTGYKTPLKQLQVLKERGFVRAYRSREGNIILERAHYLAVCRGQYAQEKKTESKGVNVSFLRAVNA